MNFKPSEFFLGLVEFITVLLPGTIMAALLLAIEGRHPLVGDAGLYRLALDPVTNTLFWTGFVLAAFGLGYFLGSFASGMDALYDVIRRQVYPYDEHLEAAFGKVKRGDINYEAFRQNYTEKIWRRLLHYFFEFSSQITIDRSYGEANRLKLAQEEVVPRVTNTFKWAKILLEVYYPTISAQTTRIMAASKFFRSLVVVGLLLLIFQVADLIKLPYWISVALLVLSFREYIVQRQKSTQLAYRAIVVLLHTPKALLPESR